MEMATVGPGVAGGNNRQALTDEDLKPLPGLTDFVRQLHANRPAEPGEGNSITNRFNHG